MTPALGLAHLPASLVRDLTGRTADPLPTEGTGGVRRAPRVDGETWLRTLPRLVREALDRWQLTRDDGEPLRSGCTALVVPVRRPQGDPGMLKVGWPHHEADTEHLALRAWKGDGAVRLLAADPASATLLLERLDPDRDLTTGSVLDTTVEVGRVLRTLDRPAPPWAPPLSAELDRLRAAVSHALDVPAVAHRFPRRMLQESRALAADLLAEGPAVLDTRLVHGDLHQANVLWRPEPAGWVAIDPKPVAGDPHWAVAPALWNRWEDVLAASDARAHLRLRLGLICEEAGLDEDRARAMTILRMVQNALWEVTEPRAASELEITKAVAIIKAAQRD